MKGHILVKLKWLLRGRALRPVLVAVASAATATAGLVAVATTDAAAASDYVIVVVPPGGTQPSGSFNQVVASIGAAKTAVEQNNSSGNVTVELTSGIYRLASPLTLGTPDGGQNGYHVIWQAYPGATPVISGAEQVSNWTLYNSGSNIWEANVGTSGGTTTTTTGSEGYPNGYQSLTIANDNLCLDSYGNTSNAGAIIDQWACNGQSNQDFQFVPTSGGYGELQVESSGQDVAAIAEGSSSASAQGVPDIVQEPVNGNAASQWLPEQQSDGSWQFKNQNSGLCLDVYGATSNQGQQLDQWPCKNAPGTNQDFTSSGSTGGGGTTTGLNTRELYVNGAEVPLASMSVASSDVSMTSSGFTITNSALQSQLDALPDQSQLEFSSVGSFTYRWAPVQSINGPTITMQQPAWENNSYGYDTFSTGNLRIYDSLSFLTSPNEWYLDSQTGQLYYEPPSGQNPNNMDVELPLVQSLVDMAGTYSNPVRNLTFQGIQFSGTSWLGPSSDNGYADQQNGTFLAGTQSIYPSTFGSCRNGCSQFEATRGSWDQIPAAVEVAAANGVTFADDTFSQLGEEGLGIGQDADANASGVGLGASDITIANNTFTEDAAGAIVVGGVQPSAHHPSSAQMVDQDVLIENNTIDNVGLDYQDCSGILSTYVKHSVITHNELHDLPYDGIDLGFGWGMFDPGGSGDYNNRGTYNYWPVYTTATTFQDNVVSYNLLYNTKQVGSDGGTIYTLSAGPGTAIFDNYSYNNRGTTGWYNDEGSRFFTWYNNVISGAGDVAFTNANGLNNTDDNVFYNNWYSGSFVNVSTGSPHYNVFNANTSVSNNSWPSGATAVMSQAGLQSGLGYPAPAIATAPQATLSVGSSSSATVEASGSPTPSLSESGALPSGVNFTDNGNGTATISGTPASGSAGSYAITITASNGVGSPATEVFTLTVLATAPSSNTVTLAGRVTDSNGDPFSGVCAYLYLTPTDSSSYSACTGANGSYEIDGIVPGALSLVDSYHYQLEFIGSTGTEWYDGVPGGTTNRSDAGALQLQGRIGTAVTGVNFIMPGTASGGTTTTTTTTTTTSGGGGYPSGYHTLVVANDNLCLDSFGNTANAGAIIDQWACNGGSNQDFQFVPTSGGYGELQVESSGQDVTAIAEGSSSASAQGVPDIVQEPVSGTSAAQWLPEQQSDGSWQFKNQNSGLCLDVYGATSNQGQQLDQWPCKNAPGTNQDFKV
jgi:hypothetical protein